VRARLGKKGSSQEAGVLLSQSFDGIGRVFYPMGAGTQIRDLVKEVDEYFRDDIAVRPDDVVFDVGANLGVFALHACMKARGHLRLFCFEPIPELFQALRRNLESNALADGAGTRFFNAGVTREGGPREALFHYFKRLPCDTTQHLDEKRQEFNSFFDAQGDSAQRALGAGAGPVVKSLIKTLPRNVVGRWLFDRAIGVTPLRAPLVTIAEVVEAERVECIDLLKVDVEGAELDVLRGVGPAWPKVRQVVLEGHDIDGRLAEVTAILEAAGFTRIVTEVPPLAVERGLNNFVLRARRSSS